jgi:cell division protein FtsI (penicillin-binding protein 3)
VVDLKEKRRLIIFLSLLGAVVLLVFGQLGQLMILAPGQEAPPSVRFPAVERGPILDRGGKILAITTRLDSVTAWIPSLENADETAALLAQALQLDAGEIREKLRRGTGFLYLKRKITPTESDRILELIQEGRLKGISLTPEFGRSYPEKQLGCHALGYVGVDNVGLEGIEYSLNEELSPAVVGGGVEEVYGNQVYLTLDLNIQHAAEKAALKAYRENQAESVFVLVMEARTGEILAYCAVPGFDPNEYSRFEPQALKNRIAGQAYEPGSVLKIVSIASFLDLGAIRETDTFRCTGVYERTLPGGRSLRIRDVGVHGQVDAGLIIRYSCNAGAAYASEAVDAESFYRYLRRFGFGQEVGLPFPGESAGMLAPPARWSARTKPTLAFGHEISVSALQIMAATSVFANGGQLLKPFIVRKIVSPQGKVLREFSRETVRQVVSPQVAGAMLRMMEAATEEEDGTARRGRVEGVRISAKTGTAQVADPQTGTYSQTDYVASFLGILPADDPDLIVYVVIHHPRGAQYYGSQVAAPVFKEVVEEILPYRGILRQGESLQQHSGEVRVRIPGPVAIGSEMPDLTGTPKRLLLPLLAEGKRRVRIRGEGYVVRQSPPAGTVLGEDSEIVLELE